MSVNYVNAPKCNTMRFFKAVKKIMTFSDQNMISFLFVLGAKNEN